MKVDASKQATSIKKKNKRRKSWHKILYSLAFVMVMSTTYVLVLPAITMEKQPVCGLEEHSHDADCYETQQHLICTLEECEGHTHDESCYETVSELTCTLPECEAHTHTPECYDAEGNLICGLEETPGHVHGPECYTVSKVLVCGKEEKPGHKHDQSCYETENVLVCTKPEHKHSDACYETAKAEETTKAAEATTASQIPDPETEGDWKKSFEKVRFTDDVSENLAAIAKTQIGYKEDTKCTIQDNKGETKGFTRYGAWYGEKYADWNSLFVLWCMNYAQIDKNIIPTDADCKTWVKDFAKEELYVSLEDYIPVPGDIVFIDDNEGLRDGSPDMVGIVTEVKTDASGEKAEIKVAAGDVKNKTDELKLKSDDKSILGYTIVDKKRAEELKAESEEEVETSSEEETEEYSEEETEECSEEYSEEETEEFSEEETEEYSEEETEECSEEETEECSEDETEEESEEETEAEMYEFEAELWDGTVMKLSGDPEVFGYPMDEITFTARELGEDEADEERCDADTEIISEALADESRALSSIRLFEVDLWYEEEKIEPEGPVTLTLTGDQGETDYSVTVLYVDEENQTTEDMNAEVTEEGDVTFETEHLSVYGFMFFGDEPAIETYDVPDTIRTVDNISDGITINLFDYFSYTVGETWDTPAHDKLEETNNNYGNANWASQGYDVGINSGHPLKFYSWGTPGTTMNNYTDGEIAMQGIVQNKLSSTGYPQLTSDGSGLNYLFDPNFNEQYRTDYLNTNHLLQKDSNGYYKYDSDYNYAYYNQSSKNFSVYNTTYVINNDHNNSIAVGFFPFNQYNIDKNIVNPWEHGNTKDQKYQNSHHFGLTMTANFLMPEDRKVNGQDMVFEFSGDDDVWVFIDGVLVLDMGGIHGEVSGKINFTEGTYWVNNAKTCDEAKAKNASVAGTEGELALLYANAGVNYDFSGFSEHKISFFYVERGGCYSNCSLSFNLPTFQKKQIELEKKLEGTDSEVLRNKEFQFQLYLTRGQGDQNFEVYTGPAKYSDGTDVSFGSDGTFTLRPEQKIIFPEMISLRKYYFKEVGLNSSEIEKVIVNGTEYRPDDKGEIETEPLPIKDQCQVVCTNKAPTVDLRVNKEWSDGYEIHNGGYVTYHILRRHKDTTEKWVDINNGNAYYVGSNDNWSVSHENLPKSDANGEFEYKVVEDSVDGYYPSITSTTNGSTTTFNITNNEAPEKPKVTVEKKWFNSDGKTPSPFAQDVVIELWRRYTIPSPKNSHTVTFYASAYTWDSVQNKQVITKIPIETVKVADGGSVSFASSLWYNRAPNLVYRSGSCSFEQTGETRQLEGENSVNTPVYKCSNVTNDVNVTIVYDDIWESVVNDNKIILITEKTEPQQPSETPGEVKEEKVDSVTLNKDNPELFTAVR